MSQNQYKYRLFVENKNGETEVTFRNIKKGDVFQFPFGNGDWNLALRDSSLWEMLPDDENQIRKNTVTFKNIGTL